MQHASGPVKEVVAMQHASGPSRTALKKRARNPGQSCVHPPTLCFLLFPKLRAALPSWLSYRCRSEPSRRTVHLLKLSTRLVLVAQNLLFALPWSRAPDESMSDFWEVRKIGRKGLKTFGNPFQKSRCGPHTRVPLHESGLLCPGMNWSCLQSSRQKHTHDVVLTTGVKHPGKVVRLSVIPVPTLRRRKR
eukprot:scaffold1355_cov268-Pinguiococcus_pyrenoidosus.AAC.68